MIIDTVQAYGVTLHRLTQDKIEKVRQWRNDPKIQQYMFFREYITPEMQQAWFKKIDNENNYYFIIEYDGHEVGLINLKDIDYQQRTAESGLFIYEDKFLNSLLSYQSSLALLDFAFHTLLLQRITAVVQRTNQRALDFNLSLGYVEVETTPSNQEMVMYQLLEADFLNNKNMMRFKQILLN